MVILWDTLPGWEPAAGSWGEPHIWHCFFGGRILLLPCGFNSQPMQHPKLFAPVDGIAVAHPLSLQSDVDAVVADLVKQLHSGDSRQKAVRPKALLDNCLKVLRMLFGAHCECWGGQQGWGGGSPWSLSPCDSHLFCPGRWDSA